MIRAYDESYAERASANLGRMLDFATHDLGYRLKDFFDLFLASGVADRFGAGEATLLVGMSGVELAYEVLERSDIPHKRMKPRYAVGRSPEYWTGWALARYQWMSSMAFADIVRLVPLEDVRDLYEPYHEMDVRQFFDRMNELCRTAQPQTNLKRLREQAGLSQRELADLSGIPVRTIQQYEQRQKSINRAQGETLARLARVLAHPIEDLLEKIPLP